MLCVFVGVQRGVIVEVFSKCGGTAYGRKSMPYMKCRPRVVQLRSSPTASHSPFESIRVLQHKNRVILMYDESCPLHVVTLHGLWLMLIAPLCSATLYEYGIFIVFKSSQG